MNLRFFHATHPRVGSARDDGRPACNHDQGGALAISDRAGELGSELKAAELYRHGLAPIILIADSGVDPVLKFDESDLVRQYLIRGGVPAEAVRILPGGAVTSTREETLHVKA